MAHPPFPRGASGREIRVIERIHRIGDRPREPEVRETLSDALQLILELIDDRMLPKGDRDQWNGPAGWD